MKNKYIIAAAMLIAAVSIVQAQNKSAGINLSLWKGASTQPLDGAQTTYVNLGLFSSMNKLHGIGINGISSIVKNDMSGVQLSGICNITGNEMVGLSASGLVNISGGDSKGLLLSGLSNIIGAKSQGLFASGIMNIHGEKTSGVSVSGIANIFGENITGLALSGLLNVSGRDVQGIQISGIANISGENVQGLQTAGIMNVAGEKLKGMQLSLINYAERIEGLQIGLFNYYKRSINGLQFGLVNMNPDTRVQLMLFGGNASKINVGVRFKNELFYTISGVGSHYLGFGEKFSASAFHRGGIQLPICKKLFIGGDLGYQHIETFDNKDKEKDIPARLYALQGRLNLEYKITGRLGVFAATGYDVSRYYNKSKTYDKGVIAEAGIVLF